MSKKKKRCHIHTYLYLWWNQEWQLVGWECSYECVTCAGTSPGVWRRTWWHCLGLVCACTPLKSFPHSAGSLNTDGTKNTSVKINLSISPLYAPPPPPNDFDQFTMNLSDSSISANSVFRFLHESASICQLACLSDSLWQANLQATGLTNLRPKIVRRIWLSPRVPQFKDKSKEMRPLLLMPLTHPLHNHYESSQCPAKLRQQP